MGVPTISSVNPPSGRAGGQQVVRILGTNFRLPPDPPATGPAPRPPPTVAVSFAGRPSRRVIVLSATEVRAVVPAGAPGAADVVLSNLNPDGTVVPGETATAAAAYAYVRPDLASKASILQRVTARLILLVREQVIENVVQTTGVDYVTADGLALNLAAVAQLPAVVIAGPEIPEDRFFSRNDAREVPNALGGYDVLPVVYTVDARFAVTGLSRSQVEMLNLMEELARFFNANSYLFLDVQHDDPTQGQVKYEMDFVDDFRTTSTPNNADVRAFTGMVVVRGVDLDPTDAVAVDQGTALGDVTDPATGVVSPDVEIDVRGIPEG